MRTAEQLASETGVTVRTIYRDIEALQLAGVPIYGDSGHGGGYRLVGGFRTRLTGMTTEEAQAMFLAGLPLAAAELGLSAEVASVALKLRAALPATLRERSDEHGDRFLVDPSGWFHDGDSSPHLAELASATWEQRVVEIRYESWTRVSTRQIEPYGLVLKGGRWYVVARSHESGTPEFRNYRVGQIHRLTGIQGEFDRLPSFNLATYWANQIVQFRQQLHKGDATVRISARGRSRLRELGNSSMLEAINVGASTPDVEGWVTATIPIETETHTVSELLRLGADVEVLAPHSMRQAVSVVVQELAALYARDSEKSEDKP